MTYCALQLADHVRVSTTIIKAGTNPINVPSSIPMTQLHPARLFQSAVYDAIAYATIDSRKRVDRDRPQPRLPVRHVNQSAVLPSFESRLQERCGKKDQPKHTPLSSSWDEVGLRTART